MSSHTKNLSAMTGLLFVGACLCHGEWIFGVPHALAQTTTVTDTQGTITEGLLMLTGTLNALAFLCLKFLSYLSDPETVFGINNNTGILLRVWQISRDLMNMIFMVILLIGAILTIVFGKMEMVKQHIVKFILAVILVNFSWFFPRVIFDIANVTTATIYSLPNLVGSTAAGPTAPCVWRDGAGNPVGCVVMSDVRFPGDPDCPIGPTFAGPGEINLEILHVCLMNYDPGANTAFGIINGLVLNHGRLLYLGTIAGGPPAGSSVKDALYFGFVLFVVAFLHIMLVFPIAALTAIMLVRIPILWLTVAFMPFMFIGFIIGDKFIKVNSITIFTKHFLTAAFLPAMIAIPFSMGFIMLNTFADIYPAAPPGLDGDFKVIAEVHSWWDMVWILVSFAVIWVGSRWAMKSDEIYAKVSEPIMNAGSSFMKLPLNLPVIPHDTNKDGKYDANERLSVKQLSSNLTNTGTVGGLQQNKFNALHNEDVRKQDSAKLLRGVDVEAEKAAEKAAKQANTNNQGSVQAVKDISNKNTSGLDSVKIDNHFNQLKEILRQNGIKDPGRNDLKKLIEAIATLNHFTPDFNELQQHIDRATTKP